MYANNRLLLAPPSTFKNILMQQFCASGFYKGIQLVGICDQCTRTKCYLYTARATMADFVPLQVQAHGLVCLRVQIQSVCYFQCIWPRSQLQPQIAALGRLYCQSRIPILEPQMTAQLLKTDQATEAALVLFSLVLAYSPCRTFIFAMSCSNFWLQKKSALFCKLLSLLLRGWELSSQILCFRTSSAPRPPLA